MNYRIALRTESHVAETLTVAKIDHTELRMEVARFVGQLLQNHAKQVWVDQEWRVDVTDEAGLILYVMHISAAGTSATMQVQ